MSTLNSSVTSLRSSLSLLQSSISLLDTGVSDFPRLRKVLATQQHFELLPEPTLREAQQSVVDEVTPAIGGLLSTAEAHIAQLERREESLRARSELLEGRLENDRRKRNSSLGSKQAATMAGNGLAGGRSEGNEMKALEMKRLRHKKERLQYAVDRLELQSKQRQRELRKSMAFIKD
jgi:DASH complex subunit SPC19